MRGDTLVKIRRYPDEDILRYLSALSWILPLGIGLCIIVFLVSAIVILFLWGEYPLVVRVIGVFLPPVLYLAPLLIFAPFLLLKLICLYVSRKMIKNAP